MSGVRAALFLDFDNIYTAIAQHGQEAAEEFATNPWRWFRWLESGDAATGARPTLRHLRESAATAGVSVSRSNAQFVIKGLPAAELTALKQSGRLTGIAIGQLFRDQISNLCEDAALQLSSEESTAIDGGVLGTMGEGSLP